MTSAAPVSYQWYHDGSPIPGPAGTGELLLIDPAKSSDAGDYSVRVSNSSGVITSSAAKLNVAAYTADVVDHSFEIADSGPAKPLLMEADGSVIFADAYVGRLIRVKPDGSTDSAFVSPGLSAPSLSTWETLQVVPRKTGGYFVAGVQSRTTHGGVFFTSHYYALANDGTLAKEFSALSATVISSAGYAIVPLRAVLLASGDHAIVNIGANLVRINADGSTDTDFAFSNIDSSATTIAAAALDSGGRIFVASGKWIWRVNSDGSRDPSFPAAAIDGEPLAIAATADGGCWIATTVPSVSGGFAMEHISASGSIASRSSFTGLYPFSAPPSLVVQPDGRPVLSGNMEVLVPSDEPGRTSIHGGVLRLMSDGTVDASFFPPPATGFLLLPGGKQALAGRARINLDTTGPIEPPRVLRVITSETTPTAGDDVTVQIIAVGPGPLTTGFSEGKTSVLWENVQGDIGTLVNNMAGYASASTAFSSIQPAPPRLVRPLVNVIAHANQPLNLTATVRGSQPMNYEWQRDGVVVASGTNAAPVYGEYTYPGTVQPGVYSLRVSNALGTVESTAQVSVGPASQLVNLSVRGMAGTGDGVLIVGLVTDGPKQSVFQAIGPELSNYGVKGVLDDPVATLIDADGFATTNDNGGQNVGFPNPLYDEIGAWRLPFPDTRSSELSPTLRRANTITVAGKNNASGIVLAQIFDADGSTTRFVNLSARVFAGNDDATAITGFIIKGDAPKHVLIRCAGPALASAGVSGTLADPSLTLIDQSNHQTLAVNDDWGTNTTGSAAELRRVMAAVGAFAFADGSKDAALLVTLPPGAYTALASGAKGSTGIVLLEVYDADAAFAP